MQYRIEAPYDVFVKVVVQPDGVVTAGQNLFLLTSHQVESFQARLDSAQQRLAIAGRPFTDGRADAQVASLTARTTALKLAADMMQSAYDQLEQQNAIFGNIPPLSMVNAQAEASRAQNDYLTAKYSSDVAAQQKQDAQDKLTSATQQLAAHTTLLQDIQSRLTVNASVSGQFSSQVHAGDFVKKGHALGSVTT